MLDLPDRRRRRCAAEIGLRVAALSPARRVGADSQRRVPGGKKRSSCFTATRTHWEERAAASSLRPISTCGLRAACAGAGDPAGRARLNRTLGQRSRREHAGRHARGGISGNARTQLFAADAVLNVEKGLRVHGGAEKPCLRAQNHLYRYLFDEGRHRTLGAERFDEGPVLERWQDLRRDAASDEDAS